MPLNWQSKALALCQVTSPRPRNLSKSETICLLVTHFTTQATVKGEHPIKIKLTIIRSHSHVKASTFPSTSVLYDHIIWLYPGIPKTLLISRLSASCYGALCSFLTLLIRSPKNIAQDRSADYQDGYAKFNYEGCKIASKMSVYMFKELIWSFQMKIRPSAGPWSLRTWTVATPSTFLDAMVEYTHDCLLPAWVILRIWSRNLTRWIKTTRIVLMNQIQPTSDFEIGRQGLKLQNTNSYTI